MRELTWLSISEASDLLRRRSVSSVELTDATLRRIEATDPVVHACVTVPFERARRSADHADRELAQGRSRGPLHGILVAVKDICFMRDLPTEVGSRVLTGFLPGYDATVVRRLEAAGAVIVGKTNSPTVSTRPLLARPGTWTVTRAGRALVPPSPLRSALPSRRSGLTPVIRSAIRPQSTASLVSNRPMVGSAALVSFLSERRSIMLGRSPEPWKIALPFSRRSQGTTARMHAA